MLYYYKFGIITMNICNYYISLILFNANAYSFNYFDITIV